MNEINLTEWKREPRYLNTGTDRIIHEWLINPKGGPYMEIHSSDERVARLVEAAPKLLKALKEVVNDLEYGTTGRWRGKGSDQLRILIGDAE